jgi:plasmid stability protein
MAKRQTKTSGRKTIPAAEEPDLVLVRLQLPAPIHQDFRVEAAKEGRSMSNMARRVVEEWVAKRKAVKG